MRLFVAVEVGSEVRASATRVIEDLKLRTEQSAPYARVTWVKPEHLHLTVRFIGQSDTDLCQKIVTILDRPLQVPAFELTIEGTGSFPPKRPPRVIWAGITAGRDHLQDVEREVRSRLSNISRGDPVIPEGDEREYRPHLTLGRVKNPAELRPAVLLKGLERVVFGGVRVGAVTLFESRLSSTGPTYIPLGRTPLTGTS